MIQPALDGDVFSSVCPHVANVDVAHTALLCVCGQRRGAAGPGPAAPAIHVSHSPLRSVLAVCMPLMVALLLNYCRYEAQEKIFGHATRDKHPCEGENPVVNLPFWSWLVDRFGVSGALLSYVMMLSWLVAPVL